MRPLCAPRLRSAFEPDCRERSPATSLWLDAEQRDASTRAQTLTFDSVYQAVKYINQLPRGRVGRVSVQASNLGRPPLLQHLARGRLSSVLI